MRDRQHEVYENCKVQIGDFTYGTPTCFSWGEDAKCTIGKFCSIGANVQIYLGGNHHNDWLTTYPFNAMPTLKGIWGDIDGGVAASKGDVIIGNDVWIANGAVVTKYVPDYCMVGGGPARMLKWKIAANGVAKLKWWDWEMEKLAEAVPILMDRDAAKLIQFSEEYDRRKEQNER